MDDGLMDRAPKTCNASLSTMWAAGKFTNMQDFINACRRLGFAGLELNYQVNSAMLEGIDFGQARVTSVHDPCPADIGVDVLKARDWIISATDEVCREQGVRSVKRSIDLASSLGARTVVVHAGNVRVDGVMEKELYRLYRSGEANTSRYLELRDRLMESRAALVEPRFEAVQRSLEELLAYARPSAVCLGLENRYHYLDIPLPEEMDSILQMADREYVGFWYDVGHAQALDRLGFSSSEEWLQRFGARIVGVHLHDAIGIDDHRAPGTGEVDFAKLAGYIPPDAIHTCEVRDNNTFDQVKTGLQYLVDMGCVQCER